MDFDSSQYFARQNARGRAIQDATRQVKDEETLAVQVRLLSRGVDEAVRSSPDSFAQYGPFDPMSAARAVVAWLQAGGR